MYNAALNRPAYQSSTHFAINPNRTYSAHYGNDGSRHTSYSTGTKCAVTQLEDNPWWAVDLGHPMTIYRADLTTSVYTGRKPNIISLHLLDL